MSGIKLDRNGGNYVWQRQNGMLYILTQAMKTK